MPFVTQGCESMLRICRRRQHLLGFRSLKRASETTATNPVFQGAAACFGCPVEAGCHEDTASSAWHLLIELCRSQVFTQHTDFGIVRAGSRRHSPGCDRSTIDGGSSCITRCDKAIPEACSSAACCIVASALWSLGEVSELMRLSGPGLQNSELMGLGVRHINPSVS